MNHYTATTSLANWRQSPHNRWAFHHVRELIPTAEIRNDPVGIFHLPREPIDLGGLMVPSGDGSAGLTLEQALIHTYTDALVVLRQGSIVFDWHAPHYDGTDPHILFSVSKSVTGALAGVLVDNGQLDPKQPVAAYLPETESSAFGDCTVRNVLDMQVSLDFSEVYTGENEQFNRYRAATGWNPAEPGEAAGDLKSFLISLSHGDKRHGEVFKYMSPNSDMLGLILEAAAGARLPDLLSRHIWRPMGAESSGYITVDRCGAPRAAGGICIQLNDLARLGLAMCHDGQLNGRQVVPTSWVEDTLNRGSHEAWRQGGFVELIPHGRYRNQWYQTGNPNAAFFALGIHGQWLYVDPNNELVMAKFSSQPEPLNDAIDLLVLRMFALLSDELK